MKLEVHERIGLVGLLPKEGGYEALKAIRVARESLSFTPDEIEFYQIKSVVGENGIPVTNWNAGKAAEQIKDIPVSEYITSLFRKKLAEIEKQGKLNDNLMSLYDKFVVIYQ